MLLSFGGMEAGKAVYTIPPAIYVYEGDTHQARRKRLSLFQPARPGSHFNEARTADRLTWGVLGGRIEALDGRRRVLPVRKLLLDGRGHVVPGERVAPMLLGLKHCRHLPSLVHNKAVHLPTLDKWVTRAVHVRLWAGEKERIGRVHNKSNFALPSFVPIIYALTAWGFFSSPEASRWSRPPRSRRPSSCGTSSSLSRLQFRATP